MASQAPSAGATAIRAAKDALRKKLKKALASLSEEEKLKQSKNLVRMVKKTPTGQAWLARGLHAG